MSLTAEELLAGSALTHRVEIPADLLGSNGHRPVDTEVVLRPLTVQAGLKFEQVSQLPAGVARFLVERINAISGVTTARDELDELVQAPLARACFVLAKTFGWTPEEVSGLTIGQILLYLEMARRDGGAA